MTPDLPPGSTIAGRYAVGEVIGRGGMGEVRAGHDLRLDRDVAIKLLNPDVTALPKARERFEAEARAAARLTHPNIVVVYDSGEYEGVLFLVMERLPGRTLADELSCGPLPAERVRSVGADVLAALGAAHNAGVVHRDLKPGNVLLAADGTAKVADFGIAKAVDDVDLTTTGILLGTPAYLSPEQLEGEAATPASDMYSVGVLLYEALAGTKPFASGSPVALAYAARTREPTPLGDLRADAPPDLVAAIARAMEKEPGRRFSAEEMARALEPRRSASMPDGPATTPFSPTQRLEPRTPLPSPPIEKQGVRTGGVPRLAQGQRRPILILAVILVAGLMAVVLTIRPDSPAGPQAGPTSVRTGPLSEAPELDAALRHLEEVVRP